MDMCKECGCGEENTATSIQIIEVGREVLVENSHYAAHNREHLDELGITMFNIVGSPGAGKTAVLERTIPVISRERKIAVIEGDLETSFDKQRIEKLGVKCHQINTHGICHLDAKMVHEALHKLALDKSYDAVFVENVGNLVCPADFALGEKFRVVILSVPEGDDKPEKYPQIFRTADIVVVNKIDLLNPSMFNIELCKQRVYRINPKTQFVALSSLTGDGFDKWLDWICWAMK